MVIFILLFIVATIPFSIVIYKKTNKRFLESLNIMSILPYRNIYRY